MVPFSMAGSHISRRLVASGLAGTQGACGADAQVVGSVDATTLVVSASPLYSAKHRCSWAHGAPPPATTRLL
jgi:hypothetical protein